MPANIKEESLPHNFYMNQPSKEEIVIAGLSGRLPESDNIAEFRHNLMNKIDMVNDKETRWPKNLYQLPARSGKLKDMSKFDASFFGVNPKQTNVMDPQLRLLLEASYEAIVDAGYNPTSLRGTRTGVFVGGSASEAHEAWGLESDKVVGYSMTGCTRSMFANRISFAFDFKGPSYCVDTACSSSLVAFENALAAIRAGQCDAAIVGGLNICLKPTVTLQFKRLSMLSPDGTCKSFDASGNGYVRSEAIVAVFLQKASQARRIYCYAVHAKTNSDGFKTAGITFPSGDMQKQLISEVYEEAGVNPLDVSYIEAHGTGTQAGDPQECNALTDFFCTPTRKLPLLLGSVKSNMGHPEPASGLAALAKMIIAMEEGIIPPNLHYKSPNPNIPGLVDGRMKVVDELTPWNGTYMALNNFGFGGSNVHAIFKANPDFRPIQIGATEIPKLFITSGRTEEGVIKMFELANAHPNNQYLYGLLEELASTNTTTHPHRGYTLLGNTNPEIKEIKKQVPDRRPLWYIFSGMGTQWVGMGKTMCAFKTFAQSIARSAAILKPYGLNLMDMITTSDPKILESTLNSFVSVAAIQVALVDLLNDLGIQPDGMVGHSVGELGCGYADGGFTAEQMVLAAYWRGKCIQDAKLPPGAMAAVGLTWEEAKKMCPQGIVPACHNAEDTVTISGPKEAIAKFVEELKEQDIFAKEVNSAGVAFHSYFMKPIGPKLKEALDMVIKKPIKRTSRWVSSSIPETSWDTSLAQHCSSEYHANNLCNPVLFQEALKHIPPNAVTIEIAPHCLLQSILKRSLNTHCSLVNLMKRGHHNNVLFFLENIGKLYTHGYDLKIQNLYPPITFPVPRGTPMISSHVTWDHTDTWDVPTCHHFDAVLVGGDSASSHVGSYVFKLDMAQGPAPKDDKILEVDEIQDKFTESNVEYLFGHNIDGRTLFPATGYLVLAWKALAKRHNKNYNELPVIFENFKIQRATILNKNTKTKFEVNILPNLNMFEIVENNAIVASGIIYTVPENIEIKKYEPFTLLQECAGDDGILKTPDIYKELALRGYEYFKEFRGIKITNSICGKSKLKWTGNWVTFLDTMLQSQIMCNPNRTLRIPNRIKSIKINPLVHTQSAITTLEESMDKEYTIDCFFDKICDKTVAGGVEIFGLHTAPISRRQTHANPILEKYQFIPYEQAATLAKGEISQLTHYKDICEFMILQGLKKFLSSPDSLPNRDKYDMIINNIPVPDKATASHLLKEFEEAVDCSANHKSILSYIRQLFNLPLTNLLHKNVLKIYESVKEELPTDPLVSCLLTESNLKACLDITIQNANLSSNTKPMRAIEFEASNSATWANSQPLISSCYELLNREPQTRLEFTATCSNSSQEAAELLRNKLQDGKVLVKDDSDPTSGITVLPYSLLNSNTSNDGSKETSLPVSHYNLALMNGVLHKCTDLEGVFEELDRTLVPGAFCLVHEPTSNFVVPFTIEVLVAEMNLPRPFITESLSSLVGTRKMGFFYDDAQWCKIFNHFGYETVSRLQDGFMSTLFLFRKRLETLIPKDLEDKTALKRLVSKNYHFINTDNDCDFKWIDKLKLLLYGSSSSEESNNDNTTPTPPTAILLNNDSRVVLTSTDPCTGLIGFVNCLKQEPNGHLVRVIIDQTKTLLDETYDKDTSRWAQTNPSFLDVVRKDLTYNVIKKKHQPSVASMTELSSGCYRHVPLYPEEIVTSTDCAYVDCLKKGDLSSLHWVMSKIVLPPSTHQSSSSERREICNVHFAALNFRDIMLATGKLPPDAIPGNFNPSTDCLLGMEFSGTNSKGKRIMGLVPAKGLATALEIDPRYTWQVPADWSFKDASTVPVVYATAYYALIVRGCLKRGECVLIHSGSGGVGQAAISIALNMGCTVYTSIGSMAKRSYLKARFPQLTDDNFCNSRDLSFEEHIYKMTGGKGVDVVLNSLAEDKLQASVRLLAQHGRFLEIGKYDLSNNSALGMALFLKNVSFHGILLDALFENDCDDWKLVRDMVSRGIETGVVKPLETTVFGSEAIEEAFRYMAQGKHIGKVVIKIREEGDVLQKNSGPLVKAMPKQIFDNDVIYLITGGLGGFGLELADWLVQRGVRKLILTSRSGIKTGYQSSRVRYWKHTKNVNVFICTRDLASDEGIKGLVKDIDSMGGKFEGIFHLAAVLKDGFLENLTSQSFVDVYQPKALTAIKLDELTRTPPYADTLKHFIVFSSISCGRGNMGQTNYGLANSVMERVCERRKAQGLPGLAIQWGAIGDVGLIIESMGGNDTVVGGTLPQRMSSCLETLDYVISTTNPYPVVSSYVLAEKMSTTSTVGQNKINVIDAVAHILGIKDTSSVNQDTSLGDLGLDSLMGVEIKQTLEREYEIVLSIKEIRQLTFNKVRTLMSATNANENLSLDITHGKTPPPEFLSPTVGLELILRRYNLNELVPLETVVNFNMELSDIKPTIFFVHPIEGSLVALQRLIQVLQYPVIGFQCSREVCQDSIPKMSEYYLEKMLSLRKPPYILCAYSFGATVAFEMALQLQARGIENKLILLDGSHSFVATHTQEHLTRLFSDSELERYAKFMVVFVLFFVGSDYVKLKEKFYSLLTIEEVKRAAIDRIMATNLFPNRADLELCSDYYYQKLMICDIYVPASKYKGDITLIRITEAAEHLSSDYGLSNVIEGKVHISYIEGDHETFIIGDNAYKVANLVDACIKNS